MKPLSVREYYCQQPNLGGEKLRKEIKLLVLLITLFGFIVVPATAIAPPGRELPPPPPAEPIVWYDYEPFVAYAAGGMAGDTYTSSADGIARGGNSQWLDIRFPLGHQFDLRVGTTQFILVADDHVQRRGQISFDMDISYTLYSFPNIWEIPFVGPIILGYGSAEITVQIVHHLSSESSTSSHVIKTLKVDSVSEGAGKIRSFTYSLDYSFVTDYMAPLVGYHSWEVRISMSHTGFAGCYATIDMDIAKLRVFL
jgi:hypothetical protein